MKGAIGISVLGLTVGTLDVGVSVDGLDVGFCVGSCVIGWAVGACGVPVVGRVDVGCILGECEGTIVGGVVGSFEIVGCVVGRKVGLYVVGCVVIGCMVGVYVGIAVGFFVGSVDDGFFVTVGLCVGLKVAELGIFSPVRKIPDIPFVLKKNTASSRSITTYAS